MTANRSGVFCRRIELRIHCTWLIQNYKPSIRSTTNTIYLRKRNSSIIVVLLLLFAFEFDDDVTFNFFLTLLSIFGGITEQKKLNKKKGDNKYFFKKTKKENQCLLDVCVGNRTKKGAILEKFSSK